MATRKAATAAFRFGLGATAQEAKSIAADPRGWVLAMLADASRARIDDPSLRPSHVVYVEAQAAGREKRQAKKAAAQSAAESATAAQPAGRAGAASPTADMPTRAGDAAPEPPARMSAEPGGDPMQPARPADRAKTAASDVPKPQKIRRQAFLAEAIARIKHAQTTPTAFLERLVMFWSNHFSVNAAKGPVLGLAGAFEREAIRPHVLGRFTDMLLAVEQHPAMLIYLDNATSTGPNSRAGRNRNRGLNENLAREILELHTLGVDGGYTQDDVTNLARILTGWTVGNVTQPEAVAGRFFFARNRHEPGTWTVVGKTYRSGGENVGRQCLADLARHPSTARHIARKLARHFVSDNPPPSLVAHLEAAYRDSDGDLATVTHALLNADEAWAEPPRKILPPYDFLIAVSRAFALPTPAGEVLRLSAALGQPLWRPTSPKGWPDDDNAWMGPAALRERLRFTERTAVAIARTDSDPRTVADRILGESLGEATRTAVARAETHGQGFELLIMSPEFQRR